LEPYQKVFIDSDFLETSHGQIACTECHGGNPQENDMASAHDGIVADPSNENVMQACGPCHEELAGSTSLHYTLAPYRESMYRRAGISLSKPAAAIDLALKNHCQTCHSSCGQCHVSRPTSVEGGLVQGHLFFKKPPMATNCTSCHGSRLEKEYTGKNPDIPADVHFQKLAMPCTGCHTGAEMHAAATPGVDMNTMTNTPKCISCHANILEFGENMQVHQTHVEKVDCQVCHSLAYKNCYGCHVGVDDKGLPYYQLDKSEMNFKIGKNLHQTADHPQVFTLVRHVPVNRNILDFYGKNLLGEFDVLPTWKASDPHTIQRKTPQNQSCNNCHGNTVLFLTQKDIAKIDTKSNRGVFLTAEELPKPIQ
jgi:hypothetical protein